MLYRWDLRCLFGQLIADNAELDWFLANVVTEEWHFEHDAGRPIGEMVVERQRHFPAYADIIAAYETRFNETIPGPVEGTHELVEALAAHGVPQFALTNFGDEFWAMFAPTAPIFDHMRDIVVSGREKCVKPDPAIYAIAETRFGITPDRLLFIDDRADNIAAAEARGWHGHVFQGADAAAADLRRYGLLTP
ncbi:Hydrolase, haloacid dehalogenase-like family [Aurantiacibacter gangjinensis]|nr:Hydrolase, haloacid dehalogenase-like family [Aurantiacibacter gangjinensis]